MKKFALFFFLVLSLTKIAAQNPGDLMTDFGVGGKVVTNFGIDPIIVEKQLIQNDGKIILIGDKNINGNNFGDNTFIIRLNEDGTLDNTFNSTGIVMSTIVKEFKDAKISPAGKIILIGKLENTSQVTLCQYNSDGSLDTTFGTSGVANIPITYGFVDFDIQSNGKIIILTTDSLIRLSANGSIDTSFNNGIIFPHPSGIINVYPRVIKINTDDTLIIAAIRGGSAEVIIKKYNAEGVVDTSFNSTGIYTAPFIDKITSLDVAPNGKIIFYTKDFVTSGPNNISRYYLLQLNADGTSDTTFGVNGVVIDDVIIPGYAPPFPISPILMSHKGKIKFQPDGTSVILEEIYLVASTEKDIAVIKHNADGTLDNTFGTLDGRVIYSNFNLDHSIPDFNFKNNKIFISGNTNISPFENRIILTQLNEDGSLDTSFNNDGEVHLYLPYHDGDRINKIVQQPDGKIIVAGTTSQNFINRVVLARYNSDGTLDMSFGTNGSVFLDDPDNSILISTPILDSDNKIILLLSYTHYGYSILYKFNTDGSLDTTFATGGILSLSTFDLFGKDVKVDADHNIFVSGSTSSISNDNDEDIAIIKLNYDGSINTSFGTNGMTTGGSSTITYEALDFLKILPDGKLIACGLRHIDNTFYSFVLCKYNSTGVLDTTFNGNGQVVFDGSFMLPLDIDATSDAVFVLYLSEDAPNTYQNVIAKLNLNGNLVNNFGVNGSSRPNLNFYSSLNSLKVLPNGSLIASGRYTPNNNDTDLFLLASFTSNGSLDLGFGSNGVVTTDFYGTAASSSDFVITSDYSVILAGGVVKNNDNIADADFAMAKYYLGNLVFIPEEPVDEPEEPVIDPEEPVIETYAFYPNPTTNSIYLNPEVDSFAIFSLDGKQMGFTRKNQTVDVSHLSKGIYITVATMKDNSVKNEKIIIN